MAKAIIKPVLDVKIALELTEGEARALDALAGYDFKAFTEVFYKHMGKHYLEPHEGHLRSLFEKIRKNFGPVLLQTEQIRKQLPATVTF